MSEFGAQLKQAREERGVSLRQVATATKISPVALAALERGDLSKLPGGIFSRAFVRAYAIEVGLDPDEVVSQFLVALSVHESQVGDDEVHPEVTADDRAFLEQQDRAARWLRMGVAVLLLLVVALIIWWRVSTGSAEPDVPAEVQAPLSSTTPPPAAPQPAPVAAAATASAEPVSSQGPLWIELTLSGECWIEVATDGRSRVERIFARGERQRFEAAREIVLHLGNAGAVSWTVNGRVGRSLGNPGDVTTVTISPTNASEFYQQ